MTEIPLKGTIQSTGLPQLLAYLNRQRKKGILVITTLAFTKKVYFQRGDAIFASSTYEDDRLGEMLIKAGKITLEQFDKASEVLRETRKRLGAILVELGYITPKELFWGVKFQVKEIICSLFQLEEAEYEFVEEELPTNEVITLKMSMGNLIYEGVKRIDNWTRIRNEMPGTDKVLKLSTDPAALFQDIELSPQDRKMLSLVDGNKTIKELIDSAWIGSFEAMKTLHVLWTIGVVEEKRTEPELILAQGKEQSDTFSLEEILQPVTEDEEEFIRKVDRIFLNIENLSEHELLEVDEEANEETITKNYYRLSREYHPDRFYSTADPSLKDKLTLIFDKLSRSYMYLKEMVEKKQEITSVSSETTPSLGGNGSEHVMKGVEAFRASKFAAAVDAFRAATETEPKNAKYWSHLSLALSRIKNGFKEAEKASMEAMNLEPDNANHAINLGMIYTKKGLKQKALKQFEQALSIDPDNTRAKKEREKIRK